jgi:hypothetical protein
MVGVDERDPNPEFQLPYWESVCILKIHSRALSKDRQDDTYIIQLSRLSQLSASQMYTQLHVTKWQSIGPRHVLLEAMRCALCPKHVISTQRISQILKYAV